MVYTQCPNVYTTRLIHHSRYFPKSKVGGKQSPYRAAVSLQVGRTGWVALLSPFGGGGSPPFIPTKPFFTQLYSARISDGKMGHKKNVISQVNRVCCTSCHQIKSSMVTARQFFFPDGRSYVSIITRAAPIDRINRFRFLARGSIVCTLG